MAEQLVSNLLEDEQDLCVGVLVVDFGQPRTLVMLWFELQFGTNPPLGILY
jgi:hypothetical protein